MNLNELWKTLDKKNINLVLNKIEALKKEASKDNPIKIIGHADADGITSTLLLVLALNTPHVQVTIERKFRNYGDNHIALDLGAPREDFTGIAIDHHEHFDWKKYNLIWDNKPTSRIVYDLLKDKIPRKDKWKVVVGITGDGQPQLIPDEIWDEFGALLLTELDTIEGQIYGKYSHWKAPIYLLMHSPINYTAKVGNTYDAYVILKNASSPFDIIWHPVALAAEKQVKQVLKLISHPKEPSEKLKLLHFQKLPVVFCSIAFEEAIASDVAYRIKNIHKNKTVIVINSKTLTGSIRGDLAKYLANKLSALGFDAGGHPGYCGITIRNQDETNSILGAIAKICS